MKGAMKLILGLVGLVVILIAIAGILLGVLVDPNDYKPQIEKLARDKAGLELKIDGDIGWSLFPWLGLEINKVAVQYPNEPELAKLEQAQVSVKLLPLLSKQVQMSSIKLDGLDLNLVRGADGSTNWSPAGQQAPAQPAQPAEGSQPSAAETAAAPLALDIESIAVSNGRIRFADRQAGSQVQLQDLTLTSGRVQSGAWFPVQLGFQLQQSGAGGAKPALDAKIALKADVQLDLAAQQYRMKGLDSTLTVTSTALGGKPVDIKLGGDLNADLKSELARIDNLKLQVADLSATGSVSVQHFAAPQFSGEIKVPEFNARKLLTSLGQTVPAMQDDKALTKVALGAALGGPANHLVLNPLSLTLDDSRFTGSLGVDLGTGALAVDLNGDQLNADRYLPPKATGGTATGSTASGGNGAAKGERYSKEPVIPVEPLKTLNLDAHLALKQAQVNGIDIRDLEVVANAHNGDIKIAKLNANLFGGNVRNSAELDVRQTPVRLTVNKHISGLQIGDLLKTLTGKPPQLTGTLSSQADITARGRSVYDIVNSLNGTANFTLSDGVIKGIDMAQTACQGFNNLESLGLNSQQVDRSTPFANVGGHFNIRNGVISNQDLQASLDAMAVKGRGSVDLPKALIDYRLGLTIEENLFKKSCSVNNKLQGVEWPVNCKGSFDTPPAKLCKPDLSVFKNLLKQQIQQKVEKKVEEKVQEKLKDKLGGDAKSLLKGLFGN